MPRRTQRISGKSTYVDADKINKAGFPAFSKPIEEEVIQLLNVGVFGNTFYANEKELVDKALSLFEKVDKKFLLSAAGLARTEGFMRFMPLLALSTQFDKMAVPSIVKTPKDLQHLIDLLRKDGFGRAKKSATKRMLDQFLTEFYVIKYRKALEDAVRVSHYFKKDKQHLLDYMFKGVVPAEGLLHKYEMAKKALLDGDNDKAVKILQENSIDYTAIEGIKVSPDLWVAMAQKMGVFAFLRHLATFERNKIVDKILPIFDEKITKDNLKKARVLPFRVLQAYNAIGNQKVQNRLARVFEDYIKDYDDPIWTNLNWAIAPDVSGSMTCQVNRGAIPATIAGMFSAFAYKASKKGLLLPWGTEVYNYGLNKMDSAITIMKRIEDANGGGTYMEAPVRYLIANEIKTDVLVLITDSMEWGDGWLQDWKAYKRKVNPKAMAVLIRVDAYNTNPFDAKTAEALDIMQIYGWNDNAIKAMEFMVRKHYKLPKERIDTNPLE